MSDGNISDMRSTSAWRALSNWSTAVLSAQGGMKDFRTGIPALGKLDVNAVGLMKHDVGMLDDAEQGKDRRGQGFFWTGNRGIANVFHV